jgi:ABC-type Fe3+-hydroxamate transport system substrate-binding protein
MLRDIRALAIYFGLLAVVLGGSVSVYIARGARRTSAAPGTGPTPAGTVPNARFREGPGRAGRDSPGKVVALSLAAEEIIIGLAGPEKLAAVTSLSLDPRYSNVASEAARVGPVVTGTSIERIVRLAPDLVILAPYTDPAARLALERYGMRLLHLPDPKSFSDIEDGILRIGGALRLEGAAEAMAGAMRSRIEAARARIPPGARAPRVLRYDPADAWVAGSGTVIGDAIRLAGGTNAAEEGGVEGTRVMRRETVARWDPEVLLVEGEPAERAAIAARLREDPVLGTIAALRRAEEGGIAVLPTRTLTAVSQHAAAAVEALVEELHGRRSAGGAR